MTFADNVFKENAFKIMNFGVSDLDCEVGTYWDNDTPAYTKSIFGVTTKYNLEKEFPILTLRETKFNLCLDELLWIWVKNSNNVKDLNSKIWDAWADENGSIGKAYGYQLAQKYIYPEGMFTQIEKVIYDLKNKPNSRRILTNLYNHKDLHEMNLPPCAYSMTFNVKDGKLNGILNQRSQDFLTANNWNVVQYATLIHMLAQVSGLKPGVLLHVISDCHIYDQHIPIVKELIKKPPFEAPQLWINPEVKDFFDFKPSDFKLLDYNFNQEKYKIPVASHKNGGI